MGYLSVIICTYNRERLLLAALNSIAEAINSTKDISIELIIVDNNCTDNTPHMIREWSKKQNFSIKLIAEKKQGISSARNAGIRAASGDILVFADDDCCINPDYLIKMWDLYKNDTLQVMRGGKVELGDLNDLPYSIKLENETMYMQHFNHPGHFLIGANMAIPRDIVETVGYFDERLGSGGKFIAGEDADYVNRVFEAGFPVIYSPEIVAKHFHGRKDKSIMKKLNHGYAIGNGALYAKNWRSKRLLKHFYWDSRKMVSEIFGGNLFDEYCQLSYKSIIWGNIKGFIGFLCDNRRHHN